MTFRFKSSHLAGVSIFTTTVMVGVVFNPLTAQKTQTVTDSTGAGFLAAATAQESNRMIIGQSSSGQSSSSSSTTRKRGGPSLNSEDKALPPIRLPQEDFPKDDEEDLNAPAQRVANTIAQQSCKDVGVAVNATQFSRMARQIKFFASDDEVRDAFERFTQDSLELTIPNPDERFRSPERNKKTRGKYMNVLPDGIADILVTERSNNRTRVVRYIDSSFFEAKHVREGKAIGIDNSEYQMQGYLDYLSHSSTAAKAIKPRHFHPNGHLTYMTPAEVSLTSGVLNYIGETPGGFTPVAVYQAVACRSPMAKPGVLRMGRSILLNGSRFAGYPTIRATQPPGIPTKIRF